MRECRVIADTLGLTEREANGLALWSRTDLEKMAAHFHSPMSLGSFLQKLRRYQFPRGTLPFTPHRRPFQNLDDESIRTAIAHAFAWPEKVGRLTGAIRKNLGIKYDPGVDPAVIEVHFDVETVATTTASGAIRHGLEPDGFAQFVPAHYEDHYTLKLVVQDRERFRELRQFAEEAFEGLRRWIEGDATTGYIEHEIWGSTSLKRYPYRPVTAAALARFPLPEGILEQVCVPTTAEEASENGVELDTAKAADIHVKTPLAVLGRYPNAESEEMNGLRQKLVAAGFYEVVTEAGHKIYTAQFISMSEAWQIFRSLDKYFENAGGIVSMVLEPCVGFWRKKVGTSFVAVPPLVCLNLNKKVITSY